MKAEELLAPISTDQPAGLDCHHEPEFLEVQELVQMLAAHAELPELRRRSAGEFAGDGAETAKAYATSALDAGERAIKGGVARAKELAGGSGEASLIARAIEERCIGLLKRTGKDLAVAQCLTIASTHRNGLNGLLSSLALFEGLLGTWPLDVHPVDPDDPADQTMRANVFQELTGGKAFLAVLRDTAVLTNPIGTLTFRDAAVLEGKLPASSIDGLSGMPHLRGLLFGQAALDDGAPLPRQGDPEDPRRVPGVRKVLHETFLRVKAAQDAFRRVLSRMPVGSIRLTSAVQLIDQMASLLGRLGDDLAAEDNRKGIAAMASPAQQTIDGSATPAGASAVLPVPAPGPAVVGGTVAAALHTRDDARRQILDIAEFLERLEPSQPAPLFLRRAANLLAAKNFFDIVEDMLENSVDDIEKMTRQSRPRAE